MLLDFAQVWVLTGDKTETAINIGYSAGLLGPEMILIRLQNRGQSIGILRDQLKSLISLFQELAADTLDLDRIYTSMQASVNKIIFGKKKNKNKQRNRNRNRSKNDDENGSRDGEEEGEDEEGDSDQDASDIKNNVDDSDDQYNQVEGGMRRRKQSLQDSDYNYPDTDDIGETLNPLLPRPASHSPEQDDLKKYDEGRKIELDQLTSESLALIVDG